MKRKSTRVMVLVLLLLSMTLVAGSAAAAGHRTPSFWLTILHNNDGESQVVDAGGGEEDFGGAARFKTVVDNLKWIGNNGDWKPDGSRRGTIMVSSGDNFLAGPEFNAGLQNGIPYYDTIAMELIGYDTVALGNHDFDFGPDVLANFIDGYTNPPHYVAANLDFSGEARLQAMREARIITGSRILVVNGQKVGIIGIDTPNLPFISSPRNVVVNPDVVGVVQHEANKLRRDGVGIVILTGHLQNILNDIDLASQVSGVDAIVAGGGDELLANPGDVLIPGDDGNVFGPYPMWATDAKGRYVPVVTTSGEYRYVGRLVLGFDGGGRLLEVRTDMSGPVRVATDDCNATLPCDDAVVPDPEVQAQVVDPVVAALADMGNNILGNSEVALDGTRASVRSVESNEGNLIADGLLWQATQAAPSFGLPAPDVALQNGGGIRNDAVVPAGPISELDTFDMVPFPNFVSIVPDIPREQFKEIMENAVACTQGADFGTNPNCGSGRFAQVAGFSFEWSAAGTGQILDADGNVTTAGTRVQYVELDDGTVIVTGGAVVAGDDIVIATADFLARGGDQYPFRDAPFTRVGFTYQQALSNLITDPLGGVISAADYPEGGEGRITNSP